MIKRAKNKRSAEQGKFDAMNDVLMHVAKIYMEWHDKEQGFGTEGKLCRAEIHTIQAIGKHEGINITNLAKLFNVTKPTISEKIKKLVELKFIDKQKSPTNNKEVQLVLTKKGRIAYQNHEKKHDKMFGLFREYFGRKHGAFLESFMEKLDDFSCFLSSIKKEKEFK